MWRTAVSVIVLLGMSVALAPTVSAQKGVGLFPPGTYQLGFAGTDFSGFANNVQVFFDVSAGTEVSRPTGAPQTTTSDTQLFLSLYDYTTFTFTFACLTLDHPADFVIDNRLNSAALNTTLTPSTPTCPGTPPLTGDIGINATWTGVGPLASSTSASNYSCSGYNAESSGRGLTNTAVANFTLTTGGTATTFPPAQSALNSDAFQVEAHGAIDPACGPTGIGSGPTPAGHYRFFGDFANGYFFTPPYEFDSVGILQGNQSSQTGRGPATSSSEVDLNISLGGGSFNGFGCFAIPQSDVTLNGLVSASVQTTISGSALCSNSFPGFGLSFPLTVSATWVGSGPVMSVHDQENYQCLGYTESTSTFVDNRAATASASATMPDYLGNPQTVTFSGGFGSLTQVKQTIQANGALPQACLVRE